MSPSFCNCLQHYTMHVGNFLNAKFQFTPVISLFSENNCLVKFNLRFWCINSLVTHIKKKEKMYITLGFTSIKGLSTDIAYGFNQFNPDRANSAFISNSTPRVSAPPPYSFAWVRHFQLFPRNCVTWINYLTSIIPYFLYVNWEKVIPLQKTDVWIKWDKIYQCL